MPDHNDVLIPIIYNYYEIFTKWLSLLPNYVSDRYSFNTKIGVFIASHASDYFIKQFLHMYGEIVVEWIFVNEIIKCGRVGMFKMIDEMGYKIKDTDIFQNILNCIYFDMYEMLAAIFDAGYIFSCSSYEFFICMKFVADEKMLKLLLDNGADINMRSSMKNNLLHEFIIDGNYKAAEMFLNHGVRPNTLNVFYKYPHDYINPGEDGELARNLFHRMHDICLEKGYKKIKTIS